MRKTNDISLSLLLQFSASMHVYNGPQGWPGHRRGRNTQTQTNGRKRKSLVTGRALETNGQRDPDRGRNDAGRIREL